MLLAYPITVNEACKPVPIYILPPLTSEPVVTQFAFVTCPFAVFEACNIEV